MRAFHVGLATLVLGGVVAPGSCALAQVRISSLPAAATLTGIEVLPAVQGGGNVGITANQIKTFTGAGGGTPGGATSNIQYNNGGTFGGGNISGDCATTVLTITCTKTAGAAFGAFATADPTRPPALGSTTPAAGSFTTLSATGALTTNVTGSTQCLRANSAGVISGTGAACTSPVGGSNGQLQFNFLGSLSGGDLSGDCTTASSGLVTCLKTNGTAFTAAATTAIGTSGATIPLLNAANTWGANQTFTTQLIIGSGGTLRFGAGAIAILSYSAPTAPTITGGGATVSKSAGSGVAKYTVTGAPSVATITLAMPVTTDGYVCDGVDVTQGTRLQETADSTTAPVLTNYTAAGATANFAAADILLVKCMGY